MPAVTHNGADPQRLAPPLLLLATIWSLIAFSGAHCFGQSTPTAREIIEQATQNLGSFASRRTVYHSNETVDIGTREAPNLQRVTSTGATSTDSSRLAVSVNTEVSSTGTSESGNSASKTYETRLLFDNGDSTLWRSTSTAANPFDGIQVTRQAELRKALRSEAPDAILDGFVLHDRHPLNEILNEGEGVSVDTEMVNGSACYVLTQAGTAGGQAVVRRIFFDPQRNFFPVKGEKRFVATNSVWSYEAGDFTEIDGRQVPKTYRTAMKNYDETGAIEHVYGEGSVEFTELSFSYDFDASGTLEPDFQDGAMVLNVDVMNVIGELVWDVKTKSVKVNQSTLIAEMIALTVLDLKNGNLGSEAIPDVVPAANGPNSKSTLGSGTSRQSADALARSRGWLLSGVAAVLAAIATVAMLLRNRVLRGRNRD